MSGVKSLHILLSTTWLPLECQIPIKQPPVFHWNHLSEHQQYPGNVSVTLFQC